MKRYEPAVEHGSPVMEPYSLGDWVRYEDANKVVDALTEALEWMLLECSDEQLAPHVINAKEALNHTNGE